MQPGFEGLNIVKFGKEGDRRRIPVPVPFSQKFPYIICKIYNIDVGCIRK